MLCNSSVAPDTRILFLMKYTALLLLLIFSLTSLAQNSLLQTQQLDSVFLAAKLKLDRRESGRVSVQITQEELRLLSGFSLASVLNRISGFEFNGSTGHPGQNLGMYARGGNNRQVLVMIDGAVISDPSQIAADFDLRLLPMAQVASIEVIKGAASVLYGSGAATAVISITTKKSSKNGWAANFTHQIGTNRAPKDRPLSGLALNRQLSLSRNLGHWRIRIEGSDAQYRGLSAVTPFNQNVFSRQDGVSQRAIKTDLSYQPHRNISMGQFISYDVFDYEFDGFDYTEKPYYGKTEQLRTGGRFKWDFKNGSYAFNDQWNKTTRTIHTDDVTRYQGTGYNFDQYATHRLSKSISGVLGTQGGFARMSVGELLPGAQDNTYLSEDEANFYFFDPYVNVHWRSEKGWSLQSGARYHWHQRYGAQWVYQINPSYNVDINKETQLKLFYGYSTAFITPSLYQLFDPVYGNDALVPESNATQEFGSEVTNNNGFRWSFVYFERREKQRVDFLLINPETYQYAYDNTIGVRYVSGFESQFLWPINKSIRWTGNYTHIVQKDLLRIPRHKVTAGLDLKANAQEQWRLQWLYTGQRLDRYYDSTTFSAQELDLPEYQWIDLIYQVTLTSCMTATVTLSNVLDADASPLYGYTAQGRNMKLDLIWSF